MQKLAKRRRRLQLHDIRGPNEEEKGLDSTLVPPHPAVHLRVPREERAIFIGFFLALILRCAARLATPVFQTRPHTLHPTTSTGGIDQH